MRLFDLPAGRRVHIAATEVGAAGDDGATLWLSRRVTLAGTTTDDFECFAGVWRRRLADCEPCLLDTTSSMWVSDDDFFDRPTLEDEVEELSHR